MSQFLETLKLRLDEAQKRLQGAAAKFQVAQVEHQNAVQEFNSWQLAYQNELRREGNPPPLPVQENQKVNIPARVPQSDPSEVNKTEIVRSLLKQNPGGITPTDLWAAVNARITHRPYLYSVLKRLNDKGEIFKKRGKYFPKMTPKTEEGKSEPMVQ
jgi:hypothetical protein